MTGNQIAYWKYAEDVRHNAEMESQGRMNLSEVARHNLATEGLTSRQIGLGYAQLAETKRANTARELLQSSQLSETIRSNKARETETTRSNIAKERETTRSNQAKENETARHNERMESLQQYQINTGHSEFTTQFEFDRDYKTRVQTPIEVGKGLTNLIGVGLKVGTMG